MKNNSININDIAYITKEGSFCPSKKWPEIIENLDEDKIEIYGKGDKYDYNRIYPNKIIYKKEIFAYIIAILTSLGVSIYFGIKEKWIEFGILLGFAIILTVLVYFKF